ncbi:NADH-quinone oxidoreductase subunit J [Deinobacterium chartae]|uniref:NADH-quinone oxidoreductase subunit J n=1 Tax=Deinobacterium chartae TaxID=521158 RepID=A0A841HVM9_9DEIO|nr:NADH-quinone oxidoreductase subunit J [Deinobacterium chartae]MBB6096976.1 NADH-quinone oxidoreductase subunit J [Deinobacterium chartae]
MMLFILLALVVVTGGLVTILASNAVHAALGLVGTLLSLAILYVTLDAHFLAAVQVVVYAGAIMVLFLFVIMLLDAARPVSDPNPIPHVGEWAGGAAAVLSGALVLIVSTFRAPRPLEAAEAALRGGAPGPVGEVLFTRFLLPFEAVSILLLVAVVGSVALIRRPQVQDDPVLEEQSVGAGSSAPERGGEVSL